MIGRPVNDNQNTKLHVERYECRCALGVRFQGFLVQLNECSRHRILVIGATNLPDRIDPAVMRPGRTDKKFFVGPPDYEARFELLRLGMQDRPQDDIDWHDCGQQLEDYTCAEIDLVINEAARHALDQNRSITTGDLLGAAGNNPPAHTAEDYNRMRNQP